MAPTPRCALLFALAIPVASLPAILDERLWFVWLTFVGLAAVGAGVDAMLLARPADISVDVDVPGQVYMGDTAHARIAIALDRDRKARLDVLVDVSEELASPSPQTLTIDGRRGGALSFELLPRRRGVHRVETLWLRWEGPLGLVRMTRRREIACELSAIPNLGAVRTTALQFFGSPRAHAGLKAERVGGEGSEFESLRSWVPGFDTRSIDWKASARHRRLLSRRFRAERNHQVVLSIDSGHLMCEPLEGVPRIDHAINRALVVAYFCLRTGDRVGIHGFDASPRFFLEPVGGVRAFARLQHRTAEIEYGTAETNYTLGLLDLATRLRRRSLIVLFTEFVDTVTAELMIENLDRLKRKHVILFVTLSDPHIAEIEHRQPQRLGEVHESVVASELRTEREKVLARLRRSGIHVVDTAPRNMTVELLNRYLEIKRRELV